MSEEQRIRIHDRGYPFFIVDKSFMDDERVESTHICVVAGLKYFTNSDAACWPSVKTIAAKARLSERAVFRALKDLEDWGYIKRQQRFNGKQQLPSVYKFIPPPAVQSVPPDCGSVPPDCESYRTRSNELDSKNYNPPIVPLKGDASRDEKKSVEETPPIQAELPDDSPDKDAEEKIIARLSQPENCFKHSGVTLQKSVRCWLRDYGAETVLREVPRACAWNVEHGCKRRDGARFIGNWLRRADGNKKSANDPKIDAWFEEFWNVWPGLPDGKDGAREEWRRRFAMLRDDEARLRALDVMERQLNDLIDRGTDPQFIPRAKNFIRDADMGG